MGCTPAPSESLASDKFAIVGTALLACKSQGLALPSPCAVWQVVYLFLITPGLGKGWPCGVGKGVGWGEMLILWQPPVI